MPRDEGEKNGVPRDICTSLRATGADPLCTPQCTPQSPLQKTCKGWCTVCDLKTTTGTPVCSNIMYEFHTKFDYLVRKAFSKTRFERAKKIAKVISEQSRSENASKRSVILEQKG